MCGVGGFYGDFPESVLQKMNTLMAHRGPDGQGTVFFAATGVGLSHRRLAIIDPSPSGAQPMECGNGRHWITFNGEIYNYKELRADLERRGHKFRSSSDTEVLLRLYSEWGHAMLTRLNGIFAFAIWDAEKSELFLARDQLGVKPLYMACEPRGFIFASEALAITHAAGVAPRIDRSVLTRNLVFLWAPGSRTLLQGIDRIEPGSAVIVHRGKVVKQWRYYSLPQPADACFRSESEAISEIRRSIRNASQRQMVSDVPVAALLSGGLDSSAVVAFAREVAPDGDLACFTAQLDSDELKREGFVDDLPYARRAASALGVRLHEVNISSNSFLEAQEFLANSDFPIADPAAFNTFVLTNAARQAGFKVVLAGAGGDDVFAGYRRHAAVELERLLALTPRFARRCMARAAGVLPTSIPIMRRLRKLLDGIELDPGQRMFTRYHWLDPSLANRLTGANVAVDEPLEKALDEYEGERSLLERMLILEKRFFLADHNLLYMDQMGMRAGVEVRVPLIDVEVIATAARVPPHMKQKNGSVKRMLKKAMRGALPDDIIDRPKTGFGAPLRQWLEGPMKAGIAEWLAPTSVKKAGLVDPCAVNDLIAGGRGADTSYSVFALYAIHRWAAANGIS